MARTIVPFLVTANLVWFVQKIIMLQTVQKIAMVF